MILESQGETMIAEKRIRVAFATHDQEHVDADFERAEQLLVFDIGSEVAVQLDTVQFPPSAFSEPGPEPGKPARPNGGCCSGAGTDRSVAVDRRAAERVAMLDGFSILFLPKALNPVTALQILKRKIFPVKLDHPDPIMDVIVRIQDMLQGTPPLWLRKRMVAAEKTPMANVQ